MLVSAQPVISPLQNLAGLDIATLAGLGYDTSAYAIQQTQEQAQAQASAAEAKGASLGIPTSCRVESNCTPIVVGGSPSSITQCLYQALCSVNGGPYENSAGGLVAGGFPIALDVLSLPPAPTPDASTPAIISSPTPKPNQSQVTVQPGVVNTPMPNAPTIGTQMADANGFVTPPGDLGIPNPLTLLKANSLMILLGVGVVVYLMTRGRD